MLSDLQLVYMVPRNSTQLLNINTTKFQVEREPCSLLNSAQSPDGMTRRAPMWQQSGILQLSWNCRIPCG